jgi:exosortase family protein XrtM
LRALGFLLLFGAFQLGWQALQGSAVADAVVQQAVVQPAVWLVNAITPAVQASVGPRALRATGGGLNIRNGCEGLEAEFLLCAAILVFPLRLAARLRGVLAGTVLVFLLNQLRILVLFYAWRGAPALFDALHGTVTPILMVLGTCLYFTAWLTFERRHVAQAA